MIIIRNYKKLIYILFDYNILIVNDKLSDFFNKDGLIFIMCSWYKTSKVKKIVDCNKDYKIVILANSLEEQIYFRNSLNCDVLFCNHNAFINENKFNIIEDTVKIYDLVIDSAFHNYKNVNIANKIDNTVHIGYFKKDRVEISIPKYGLLANSIKNGEYQHLCKETINNIYNQSLIGGIFSEKEGACFASSQYLLSGLPVISINSVGGRDIWYNKDNSIICQNNEDSVCNTIDIIKKKIHNGEFNNKKIRENHLKQMDEHRNTIINYINEYFNEYTCNSNDIKKQFAFF